MDRILSLNFYHLNMNAYYSPILFKSNDNYISHLLFY